MGFYVALSDGEVKFDLNLILEAQIEDLSTGRGDLSYLELRYLKSDCTIGSGMARSQYKKSRPLAAIFKPLE